jgi:hypothetical protein
MSIKTWRRWNHKGHILKTFYNLLRFEVLESSFVMHFIFVLTLDHHVLLVNSWESCYWQRLVSNQRTWPTSRFDLHAPVCMFWLIKFSLYVSAAICITRVIQKETVNVLMTVLESGLTVFNKASYTFIIFGFLLIPSRLVSLCTYCAWIYKDS